MAFKKFHTLTEEEKSNLAEMNGKISIWIAEHRHIKHMADELKMEPYQIAHNIDEMLYDLKKYVGWKRYLRILFWK